MAAYIDDFLSVVPEEHSKFLWDTFTEELVVKSGLQLLKTPSHLCPPAAVFTGLGVVFDLDKNEARIPENKLEKIRQLVATWSTFKWANRKQLQEQGCYSGNQPEKYFVWEVYFLDKEHRIIYYG